MIVQQKLTLQGCFHVGKVEMLDPIPSTERTPLMTSHDSSPLLTQASGVKDRRLGCCSKNFVKDGGNFVVSSTNCALISYLEGFFNYFF